MSRRTKRLEPPMRGDELLDEVEYLINCGTHPVMAAQMLHRTPAALERYAQRFGRRGLGQGHRVPGLARRKHHPLDARRRCLLMRVYTCILDKAPSRG